MIHRIWRLSETSDHNNLGLACTDQGLLLGRTPLIARRDGRFVVRERDEIEYLLSHAYGRDLVADRLMPGLAIVAAALNANDQGLARIAAVHLQIPDLPTPAARDAMEAADVLVKYARDEGGGGGSNWNPALHPRAGTPPNPGWFSPTEGAGDASSPIRTAQNDNPPRRLDYFLPGGALPGDPFPSADEAAVSALLLAFALARSAKLEYAGRIYQNADGTFSFTEPETFSQRAADMPNRHCCFADSLTGDAPPGTIAVGSYHTHPVEPDFDQAEFSMDDKLRYTKEKLPGYLAGADREGIVKILRFTPGDTTYNGVTRVLGIIAKDGSFIPR
jgi:Domain of unknown function (DUF4329)